MPDKGLVPRIRKELSKRDSTNNLIKKQEKGVLLRRYTTANTHVRHVQHCCQGDVNPNHNELSLHTCQNS